MSELVLEAVADGPLHGLNARFAAGCSVVLGADPKALGTFVEIAAGARAPRRGRVSLDGSALHASPTHRRSTASLLADESLPSLGRVSEAVGAILAARSDARNARAFLEDIGLAAWATRPARDLDASERRTLLCALSLAHPNPRLLALYEPLAAGRGLGPDFVLGALARAASSGAVVLVATQSLDDARTLEGVPFLLDHGSLVNVSQEPFGSMDGSEQTFVLETPDARRLSAALAREPAVRGVRWNEEHAPDTLFVLGSDTERLASAIVRVLAEESASVRSLGLAKTSLEALLAVRAHAVRTAFASTSPYGAEPPTYPRSPGVPWGGAAASFPPTAPAPPDQSVTMPTSFADPTRPPGGTS